MESLQLQFAARRIALYSPDILGQGFENLHSTRHVGVVLVPPQRCTAPPVHPGLRQSRVPHGGVLCFRVPSSQRGAADGSGCRSIAPYRTVMLPSEPASDPYSLAGSHLSDTMIRSILIKGLNSL